LEPTKTTEMGPTRMMRVKIENDFCRAATNIWFIEDKNGKHYAAKPVGFIFKELKEGWMLPDPTMIIDDHSNILQALYDALHECGYIKQKEINQDFIKAKEEHLNDMRLLVFKKPIEKI